MLSVSMRARPLVDLVRSSPLESTRLDAREVRDSASGEPKITPNMCLCLRLRLCLSWCSLGCLVCVGWTGRQVGKHVYTNENAETTTMRLQRAPHCGIGSAPIISSARSGRGERTSELVLVCDEARDHYKFMSVRERAASLALAKTGPSSAQLLTHRGSSFAPESFPVVLLLEKLSF